MSRPWKRADPATGRAPTTLADLRRRITAEGYRIDDATGGHARVLRPNGTFLMPLPCTPSEPTLTGQWRMFRRLKSAPPRNTPHDHGDDQMATRTSELVEILDGLRETPGWRVEDARNGFKVYPPDSQPVITVRTGNSDYRSLPNLLSQIRRSGLPDFGRDQSELNRKRDPEPVAPEPVAAPAVDPGPVEVVERAPSDTPGVEEVLLSDSTVVYGCTAASCRHREFITVDAAAAHRADVHPGDTPAVPSEGVQRRTVAARVTDTLAQLVEDGAFGPPGAQLPTQKTLGERFGVSVFTINKVVKVLVERGVLLTVPSIGVFRGDPNTPRAATPPPVVTALTPAPTTTVPETPMPATDPLAEAIRLIEQARIDHATTARVTELEHALAGARARVTELEQALGQANTRTAAAEKETAKVRDIAPAFTALAKA